MIYRLLGLSLVICSFNSYSQSPQKKDDLDSLNERISELEQIQKENSEIQKRQLTDQYFDQNSRGYIETKFGLSSFDPKDINDENDEVFSGTDGSKWERFKMAFILELEIGKTILSSSDIKHEFGIGYQHFRSKIDASYSPSGGGGTVSVFETVSIHTLFARYAMLFKANKEGRLYFGPGFTLGYSPATDLKINIEQGDEGVQVSGEGTSMLIEIFGKSKFEFSRYLSLVSTAGYRFQRADNLKLSAADLVSFKTSTDLDASGVFATLGVSIAF